MNEAIFTVLALCVGKPCLCKLSTNAHRLNIGNSISRSTKPYREYKQFFQKQVVELIADKDSETYLSWKGSSFIFALLTSKTDETAANVCGSLFLATKKIE